MNNDLNLPTASLWRRLAALAYDALVVLAILMLLALIINGIYAAFQGEFPGEYPRPVVLTLIFTICFFYYSHSWRRGGQTIGMKAWRIKLVNDNPKPLQLSQFMLRTGIGFFSIILAGLGFWWALIDKQQRSWHDIASYTHVVFKPKGMD